MVRGTALALERFGNLSLAQTIAPAIELADAGFAATPRYADVSCNSRSQNSPESRAFFCPNGGGTLGPVVGSLVQNKPLAATLRLIAEKGADCFYLDTPGCDIARGIVEGQKFNRPQAPGGKGGSMTLTDLANYQPVLRAAGGGYLPWLPDQERSAALLRRADDDPDAEDAGALPDR
jgi:gamma-glutamyltranspeptidase/glutathione hydrolase